METIEYRVRQVTRFVVTRYTESENSASLETLGEFDSERFAYEVAQAMRSAPETPKRCVIVQRGFEVDTRAFYAETMERAAAIKADAERDYGGEFRIFTG